MNTLHNPDNLTPEQVGEGWRLLREDQKDNTQPATLEVRHGGGWTPSLFVNAIIPKSEWNSNTYRVPVTASPLVSRIADEIAEKQALLETVKAIESGAEWEVKGVGKKHPPEAREWHTSLLKVDSYINDPTWLIRLKPAPKPAPFWDCAADVPMNCRLAVKGAVKGQQYGIGYIDESGIGVNRPSGFNVFKWAGIEFIEYTLDGVTFHPCRKGGPR